MRKFTFLLACCFGGLVSAGLFTQCQSGEKAESREVAVKNIIYLIGDGMGLVQVNATIQETGKALNLERAQYVGLQKTHSSSHRVTDSAASGTALASGVKTYNGAIGVDPDTLPVKSMLEKAAENGLSTGLIATYRITHATPAAFIGHVKERGMEEEIASDFLETDITLFIGGGRKKFEEREDGRNLSEELKERNYRVVYSLEELSGISEGKVAGLLHDSHLPRIVEGRDPEFLVRSTEKALEILSQNEKGFLIMIEGSQIDGGGHANSIEEIVTETVDFDRAIKAAFDFADRNPGTLVVVTADHETGGLTIKANGEGVDYHFSTGGHTGTMVPVYAYGTGAEHFTGIMENTDIPKRMMDLLGL